MLTILQVCLARFLSFSPTPRTIIIPMPESSQTWIIRDSLNGDTTAARTAPAGYQLPSPNETCSRGRLCVENHTLNISSSTAQGDIFVERCPDFLELEASDGVEDEESPFHLFSQVRVMALCNNKWHPTYAYISTNILYLQVDATYGRCYAVSHNHPPPSDFESATLSANMCSEGYSGYLVSGLISTVRQR